MRADVRCRKGNAKRVESSGMAPGTYDDAKRDADQIPHHILSPRKPRVAHLNLAQVRVDEVCVEQNAQVGSSDQEGGR